MLSAKRRLLTGVLIAIGIMGSSAFVFASDTAVKITDAYLSSMSSALSTIVGLEETDTASLSTTLTDISDVEDLIDEASSTSASAVSASSSSTSSKTFGVKMSCQVTLSAGHGDTKTSIKTYSYSTKVGNTLTVCDSY